MAIEDETVGIPSAIDCPECSTAVPLMLTAHITHGRDVTIRLVADISGVVRSMVDHVVDAHGRPDSAALGTYVNERTTLALTGARVLVEEMLGLVGLEPTGQPGQYTFPASLWASIVDRRGR
jgi:hypothetical protein